MPTRFHIFPSRFNMVMMKNRIVSASKGLSLLQRKRDALDMRIREITTEWEKLGLRLNELMREAIVSLTRANFLGTDFKPLTVMKAEPADLFVRVATERIVGVILPKFKLVIRSPSCYLYTGLSRGGEEVHLIRKQFQEITAVIVEMGSLQYALQSLQSVMTTTKMRTNGLEYVVLPRLTETLAYIRDELEEQEREDFYRLKCSQAKQHALKQKFAEKMNKYSPVMQFTEFDMDAFDHDVRRGTSERRSAKLSVASSSLPKLSVVKFQDNEEVLANNGVSGESLDITKPSPSPLPSS